MIWARLANGMRLFQNANPATKSSVYRVIEPNEKVSWSVLHCNGVWNPGWTNDRQSHTPV